MIPDIFHAENLLKSMLTLLLRQQEDVIVVELMYSVVALSAKLSLLLLYYNLFACHRWMRLLIYLGIGLIFVMYTASFGAFGYLCLPHRGEGWLEALLSSRCHRQVILLAYVRGPLNLIGDLYLLILPFPAIKQLHVPRRKKLGIYGIFLTGSLYVEKIDSTAITEYGALNLPGLVLQVPSVSTSGPGSTPLPTFCGTQLPYT